MPVILLKYGTWGAAGVLIGIAVAVWARPETGPGFAVIIAVCLLATIVARGIIHAVVAALGPKAASEDEAGDEEEDAKKDEADDADKTGEAKPAEGEARKD